MLAELVVHDEMAWIRGYEVGIQGFALRPCDCHRQPDVWLWIGNNRPEGRDAMPDGET